MFSKMNYPDCIPDIAAGDMIDIDEFGVAKKGNANQRIGKDVEGERLNEPGLYGHGKK
jgi:hypothetical protein